MKTILSVVVVLGVLSFGQARAEGILSELSTDQRTSLLGGQQVFVTQEDPASAWPKAWVYQLVHATPEEAAAIFTDYEAAVHYIPNVKKAKISKRIDARTVEIDYSISIPVLKDEWYTTQNTLSSYSWDNQKAYRVDWTLVRARSTQATLGDIRFEALGTETVIAYYNFVTPGSSMAGAVKGKAMKQVKETVQALVNEIQRVRTVDVQSLQDRIEILRAALQ